MRQFSIFVVFTEMFQGEAEPKVSETALMQARLKKNFLQIRRKYPFTMTVSVTVLSKRALLGVQRFTDTITNLNKRCRKTLHLSTFEFEELPKYGTEI